MRNAVVAVKLLRIAKALLGGLPFGKEYEMQRPTQEYLDKRGVDYRRVEVSTTFAGEYTISVELRRKEQTETDRIEVFNACFYAAREMEKKYGVKVTDFKQTRFGMGKVFGAVIAFSSKERER